MPITPEEEIRTIRTRDQENRAFPDIAAFHDSISSELILERLRASYLNSSYRDHLMLSRNPQYTCSWINNVNLVQGILTGKTLDQGLLIPSVARLIQSAECGLRNDSWNKNILKLDLTKIKSLWISGARLIDVIKELQQSFAEAKCNFEVVWNYSETNLHSTLASCLNYHLYSWHQGDVEDLEPKSSRRHFAHQHEQQLLALEDIFFKSLNCYLNGDLSSSVIEKLYLAKEKAIFGTATLIHEPVILELYRYLDRFPEARSEKDSLTCTIEYLKQAVPINAGLTQALPYEQKLKIQLNYLGESAPDLDHAQSLFKAEDRLIVAFLSHKLPRKDQCQSWTEANCLSEWIALYLNCSQASAQALIDSDLSELENKNATSIETVLKLESCDRLVNVLRLFNPKIKATNYLEIPHSKIPDEFMDIVNALDLNDVRIEIPELPSRNWLTAMEDLFGIDTTDLAATFNKKIEPGKFLGGGFFSHSSGNGVYWCPANSPFFSIFAVRSILDPEKPIEARTLLDDEKASEFIERNGGNACRALLEEGVSLNASEWHRLSRKVHAFGKCADAIKIRRFKHELHTSQIGDDFLTRAYDLLSEDLAANRGIRKLLKCIKEACLPANRKEEQLLSYLAKNIDQSLIAGLQILKTLLPELTELPKDAALKIVRAAGAATQENVDSLLEILREKNERVKYSNFIPVIITTLSLNSKSILFGILKPAVNAEPEFNSLTMNELIAATTSWLEIMDYDLLNSNLTKSQNSSRLNEQCSKLLDALLGDYQSEQLKGIEVKESGSGAGSFETIQKMKKWLLKAKSILKDFRASKTLRQAVIDHEVDRAYANSDRMVLSKNPVEETVFHELGHHVEYSVPGLYEISTEFRRLRVTSEKVKKLRELLPGYGYEEDEVAYVGRFFNPYVGKLYDNSKATEVVSMGIQNFTNGTKLAEFATQDHEHFLLTLGIILRCRGEI